MAEDVTFPTKTIAKLLDMTEARVGQLARDGIIPRASTGRYPAGAVPAYIRWLRKKKMGTDVNSVERQLIEKKLEIASEDLREKKRENDIADELIAPIQILTDALQKVGMQIVANLEALPLEMKRANPKLTGHDIMSIKKSIHKCCTAISEIQLADDQED